MHGTAPSTAPGTAAAPRTAPLRAALGAALGAVDRVIEASACLAVVLLLLCVASGVVTRGLGDPLAWTDEMARFLMVWLAALGWMLACRRRLHVRIRFFQDKLPRAGHRAVEAAIQAAQVLFGLVVAGYGVDLVHRNLELEATTVPISMAWMYVPLVPAGMVLAAQAAAELAEQARRQPARPVPPAQEGPIAESSVE